MEKDSISRFRTLADTSSVVAHDLCAQLHVIQFCLDELGEHVDDEGLEYLRRIGASTQYISHLVDSFRKGLKMTITDEEGHCLHDIYESFLELIKNHYLVVIERIKFQVSGNLGELKIKNQCRSLMHKFFALYSFYVDELKANQDDETQHLNISFKATKKNNRFALIHIIVDGVETDEEWFREKLKEASAEKGRIRQFLGVSLIRDRLLEDEEFLTFESEGARNIIKILVPLENNTP